MVLEASKFQQKEQIGEILIKFMHQQIKIGIGIRDEIINSGQKKILTPTVFTYGIFDHSPMKSTNKYRSVWKSPSLKDYVIIFTYSMVDAFIRLRG